MYLGATEPRVKARQAIEKRIVLSTIDELLACTFKLAVDNGEQTTEPTTDRKAIVNAIMETDDDYLCAYGDNGQVGWVRFIYGNDGWDVMSDYTTNLEPFMPKTLALIEKLAA